MFSRFERFLIAMMFALLAAGITLVFAHAQDGTPTAPPVNNVNANNCVACHQDIYDTWQSGPHGQALNDPIFTAAWNAQGKPGACLVCHTTGYDPATGKSDAEGVIRMSLFGTWTVRILGEIHRQGRGREVSVRVVRQQVWERTQ